VPDAQAASGAISLLLACALSAAGCAQPGAARVRGSGLVPSDRAFLEDLSRRSFSYFWEQTDGRTGLVRDRARADGSPHPDDAGSVASSAATGFGLSALCVGAARGWAPREEAVARARAALRFLTEECPQEHGWFYHFMDPATGARRWKSEVSSIDTAFLFGGVLTVRSCFGDDPEIVRLADGIYDRVDFPWMLAGHPAMFSHGWRPESGFIPTRWDTYSEHLLLDLLAIGSRTHPVPPAAWRAWRRSWAEFEEERYLSAGTPLFTHQYSHAWVDFRRRREAAPPNTDYFLNSVLATRAHRAFCASMATEFPWYAELWGVTASDSAKGYVAWGGPPRHPAIDGTVVPCAAAGSLMFTPELSVRALRAMKDRFGGRIYGRYGFADAFNPRTGWTGPDVLGIDAGITLLSAENLRNGSVWHWFMANPEPLRALNLVGLNPY